MSQPPSQPPHNGGYPAPPPGGAPQYPAQPPQEAKSRRGLLGWLIGGVAAVALLGIGVIAAVLIFGSDETQETLDRNDVEHVLLSETDLDALDARFSQTETDSFDRRDIDDEWDDAWSDLDENFDDFLAEWEESSAEAREGLDEFGIDYNEACFDALDETVSDRGFWDASAQEPYAGAVTGALDEVDADVAFVSIVSYEEEVDFEQYWSNFLSSCAGEEISYVQDGIGLSQEFAEIDYEGFTGFRHTQSAEYNLNDFSLPSELPGDLPDQLPGGDPQMQQDYQQFLEEYEEFRDDYDMNRDAYDEELQRDLPLFCDEIEREVGVGCEDQSSSEYFIATRDHGNNLITVVMSTTTAGDIQGNLDEEDFYALIDAQMDRLAEGLE